MGSWTRTSVFDFWFPSSRSISTRSPSNVNERKKPSRRITLRIGKSVSRSTSYMSNDSPPFSVGSGSRCTTRQTGFPPNVAGRIVSTIPDGPSLSLTPIAHSITAGRTRDETSRPRVQAEQRMARSAEAARPRGLTQLDRDRREPLDFADGHRAGEEEALPVGHAEGLQNAELLPRLDPFGDDLRMHLAREAH